MEKKIRCLIVDDEPLARDIIVRYLERLSNFELVTTCEHAIQAISVLQQQEVDLIFADIHMPEMLGTEMIRTLKNPPKVIITTAYPNYALEGYELDVVDYLVKPIQFERFLKAINKVFKPATVSAPTPSTPEAHSANDNYLFFRVNRKTVKVMLDDILYLEGMKNYVKIICKSGPVITKNSMNTIEAMLPDNLFIRVHRSFIVSKANIKSFTGETVEINRVEIPVGKLFKNNFLKAVGK